MSVDISDIFQESVVDRCFSGSGPWADVDPGFGYHVWSR